MHMCVELEILGHTPTSMTNHRINVIGEYTLRSVRAGYGMCILLGGEPNLDRDSCVAKIQLCTRGAPQQPVRQRHLQKYIEMAAQILTGSLAQASLASAARPAQQPKVWLVEEWCKRVKHRRHAMKRNVSPFTANISCRGVQSLLHLRKLA